MCVVMIVFLQYSSSGGRYSMILNMRRKILVCKYGIFNILLTESFSPENFTRLLLSIIQRYDWYFCEEVMFDILPSLVWRRRSFEGAGNSLMTAGSIIPRVSNTLWSLRVSFLAVRKAIYGFIGAEDHLKAVEGSKVRHLTQVCRICN